MNRSYGRFLICFIACFFPALLIADVKPLAAEQLLMQMHNAARELTYSGTLVYSQGRRMDSMQLYHTVINGERRERLQHLSGERREIIRRGDNLVCASPKRGVYRLTGELPFNPIGRDFAAQFVAAEKTYKLAHRGEGRVAGRSAILVSLIPRDGYRHRFDLALDKASSLLLRALMLDSDKQVLERVEYTTFSVGGSFDEKLLSPTIYPKEQQRMLDNPAHLAADKNIIANTAMRWQLGVIPESFAMVSQGNRRNSSHAANTEKILEPGTAKGESVMMYSDGLTSFSVFIASGVNLGEHSRQQGATAAYTVVKEDEQGVFSVTVVGEVPLAAAADIARSVTRIPTT